MSRKDYIKFAKLLADNMPDDGLDSYLWKTIRNGMVDIFENDNPSFNKEKFIEATEKGV